MNGKSIILLFLVTLIPANGFAEIPKIGVILPLSGKGAPAGESVRQGIQMAIESNPGIIEPIFEDGALDGARSISAFHKLNQSDGVIGSIVFASGPSAAVAPLAEVSKVPTVGFSVDSTIPRGKNWMMVFWTSAEEFSSRFISELRHRGVKKVATISTQAQGLMEMERTFSVDAASAGIAEVFRAEFLPGETDFSSAILLLKQKQPEVIFVNLFFGQAGRFAAQARALGLRVPLGSGFIFDDQAEISAAEGALEGAFFVTTAAGDGSFHRDYLSRYGVRPALGAIQGYDLGSLFIQAVRGGSKTRAQLNSALHEVKNYPGKIGNLSATENGSFSVPAATWVIRNGVPVLERTPETLQN